MAFALFFWFTTANTIPYAPRDFDCGMRSLAIEYAQYIQPWLRPNQLQDIADGLNGSPEAQHCNITIDSKPFHKDIDVSHNYTITQHTNQIYVDYINGDDIKYNGSLQFPFKTIKYAVNYEIMPYKSKYKNIILRKGKHYLDNTIHFNTNHSNMIIKSYPNEKAEISGALPLNCNWTLYKKVNNDPNSFKNIYQCDVSAFIKNHSLNNIYGLRINGTRGIRARYPNANPEIDGFGSTLTALRWLPPITTHPKPDIIYAPDMPIRNETLDHYFQTYQIGIGGSCTNQFDGDAGYWCSGLGEGGGPSIYMIPTGLKYSNTVLPNSPYNNLTDAIINTWRPSHWSNWMFIVDEVNSTESILYFLKGGFQGARGATSGAEFFIENVFEELDFPTEWFYNSTTHILYYYNNETNINPNNLIFEITNLKILFNLTDTKNITLSNLMIRDTAYTYMDSHGMPSGGDWSLARQGAVYISNCTNINIINNHFTRLDSNAISINKYNRNITIYRNEIVWNGDNIISLWGDTDDVYFYDKNGMITGMGSDGYTNKNQPRFINISYNLAHEFGIFEKQSSFVFQSKSCENIIEGNIVYNAPRAGINFNDGFGGLTNITKNLIFNQCRESGDHGPINSWDRQVYETTVRNGTVSTTKQFDYIYSNFIIANYNGQEAVDNDDGSSYYDMFSNFFVYGQRGLKSDFSGHDTLSHNNIYAYLWEECFMSSGPEAYNHPGTMLNHIDMFYNNTCILNIDKSYSSLMNYGYIDCSSSIEQFPKLGNNNIYYVNQFNQSIMNMKNVGLCGLKESEFQSKYNLDLGTNIYFNFPNNTQILQKAKALLWNEV